MAICKIPLLIMTILRNRNTVQKKVYNSVRKSLIESKNYPHVYNGLHHVHGACALETPLQ